MTNRTKAIVGLSGVFILGAVCGALAVGLMVRHQVKGASRFHDRDGFTQYFVERLELTEAQRDSLSDELEQSYVELARLRAAVAGEYGILLDSLGHRLSPSLRPEQRELLRKAEQRLRRKLAGGPKVRAAMDLETDTTVVEPPARIAPAATAPVPAARTDAKDQAFRVPREKIRTPVSIDTTSRKPSVKPAEAVVDADPGEVIEEKLTQRLRERLALTDSQAAEVDRLVRETRRQIRHDVAALAGRKLMQREAVRRNLAAMDQQIQAQLDERQRLAYEEVRAEIQKRGRKHFKGRRMPPVVPSEP